MKRLILMMVLLGNTMLIFSGCGGSDTPEKTEVKKDSSYYKKEFKNITSLKNLYTDKRVLFNIEALEKELIKALPEINASTISEIVYQVQQQIAIRVKNIDGFSFSKNTAVILEKTDKNERVSNKKSSGGLMQEIDSASLKIIGKKITSLLPDNFETILSNGIDKENDPSVYLSVAPTISDEIACPPSGVCRDRSPIKQWKNGSIVEVQMLRYAYEREVEDIMNLDTIETRANGAGKVIVLGRTWTSGSYGYRITALNFDDGTSSINFSGTRELFFKDRDLQSYRPFGLQESFELVTVPNNGSQQAVCLTDGSWIGSGETYYEITKIIPKPWSGTYATWVGAMHLNDILDINNAAEALSAYRSYLQGVTSDPLPSQWGPNDSVACTAGNPFGTAAEPGDDVPIDPMNRVSMTEVAMNHSSLSGQDIFNMFRGEAWGTHPEDISGLTMNWIRTLNSLGIINGPLIAQNIRDRWTNGLDGRFIFKKLELPIHPSLELLPVDEDVEELLILPKTTTTRGSYPTNLYVEPIPPVIMPGGRPNPNYCAELKAIPLYLVDPKVMLELVEDVEYLTYNQLNRLQDEKKLRFWEEYNQAVNGGENYDYPYLGYGEIPGLVYSARKVIYHRDGGTTPKDEAYYDALIDRLIVLNPILDGNKFNHPCLSPGVVNPWLAEINDNSR